MKFNNKYVFFAIILILLIIGKKIGKLVMRSTLISNQFSIRYISIIIIIYSVCLVIPLIIYLVINKLPIKETLKLNNISIKAIFITIVSAILFFPLLASISDMSTNLFNNNEDMGQNTIMDAALILLIIHSVIVPPIVEELIFRGVILSDNRKRSITVSIILNGFLFSIFHLNLQQSLYTFFMGVLLSVLVIQTNSIFPSIIAHMTINGINLLIQRVIYKTTINNVTPSPVIDSGSDIVPIWISYLFFFVCAFIAVILIKKIKKVKS